MLSYLQAIILGIVQGATELFPISSLGHSVLIANLFNWHNVLNGQTHKGSPLLLFLVIVHVATAVALIIFYRTEWVRIIKGLIHSLQTRKIETADEKLAWLLIAATIPAGLIGLVFESSLRDQFAKPLSAIFFIIVNGFILLAGDKAIQRHEVSRPRRTSKISATNQAAAHNLSFGRAVLIGIAQIGALFAGISRSGITMVSGLYSGLNHEDSARFSFLLATPIILGAGLYKLPGFLGHEGDGIRGQALVGAILAGVAAYYSVKFLDKYFQNKRLKPFGIYCISLGVVMLLLGIFRGHF